MVQSESSQQTPQRRIARPVPLRESVYEAILDMIVTGGLRPGQHLVENELAIELGVSRQPVREALQWLKNDGWVQLRPGHGAFVHAPTPTEVDQLLAVRTLLGTESARLAASNATEAGVQRLRELCERGVGALADDDIDAAVAANAEFHTAVTQLSGNEVLVELAAQVDRRVRWYFTPVVRHRGRQSWREHNALIDAIVAGDGDGAAKIMREHTEHTRESYLEQRAEAPEAPEDDTAVKAGAAGSPQRRRAH